MRLPGAKWVPSTIRIGLDDDLERYRVYIFKFLKTACIMGGDRWSLTGARPPQMLFKPPKIMF